MERLDKVLAGTGRWSRREVKDLVRQGRVRIDGVTARTAEEKLDPDAAAISVDGQPVETERFTYVMLHKPAGVLSATEDSRQSTVLDLLPPELRKRGLSPVGRLDKDTEGLLLLTNDGELAQRLTHPRHHQPKVYEVLVRGPVPETALAAMRQGMRLAEGQDLLPVDVERKTANSGNNTLLRMVLCQGVNRQIRRMCRDLGLTILRLRRVAQGPLDLGELTPGQARQLTAREVAVLRSSAGLPSSA